MPTADLPFTAKSLFDDDTVSGNKSTEGGFPSGHWFCLNDANPSVGDPGDAGSAFRINVADFPWDTFTLVEMDLDLVQVWGDVDAEKDMILNRS